MSRQRLAGIGGVAFGVLTYAGNAMSRAVGGNYDPGAVARYLAPGHHALGIASIYVSLAGVLGLLCLLAELREALDVRAARLFSALGVAAAACFALGAAVTAGQVIAHTEGGAAVTVAPATTYLISEVGVVMSFGAGALLLGVALIVLSLAGRATLPLRRSTFAAGVCGIASLAWLPFFGLLLWAVAIGARHVAGPLRRPLSRPTRA